MLVYEDIPEGLKKFYNDWKQDRDNFLQKAKRYEEYYFTDVQGTGTTYDIRQTEVIKQNTNIPVSVNFIYPIVHKKKATMVKKKPSFQIVTSSEDKKYKQYAYVLDKAIYSMLRNSSSLSKVESHCQDILIQGMAFLGLDDEDTYTSGQFPFGLCYYPNHNVILDAGSRLKEGTDMRGYFIEKEISKDYAQFKFGSMIQDINDYYNLKLTIDSFDSNASIGLDTNRGYGLGRKTLIWKRYYDMVFTTMYFIENPESGDIEFLFKENYFPEQIEAIFKPELILGQEQNMYVRRSDMLGDKIILSTMMPLTKLPGKATYFDWGGRPYRSYGMVHREIGKQDAIDKIVQMLLLNGILQNNAGWTGPEGSLSPAQKEIWKQAGNDPRVFKEFKPVVINDQVIVPKRDEIQPLSPFYPQMLVLLKNSMEYSTGSDPTSNQSILSEGTGKIEVFSSLQQYQNAAMERVELTTDQINYTMEYLGNVAIEYILHTIKPDQTYTFLDETGSKINEIKIYREMVKDFKLTKYRLLATPSEAHPTQKIAMATEMFKIAQTTQDGTERNIFVKKAFELLDMRGFDEMVEELSEVKKLTQFIEKLQEEMDRLKELNKQYENRSLNADYRAKLTEKLMAEYANIVKASAELKADNKIKSLEDTIKELNKTE